MFQIWIYFEVESVRFYNHLDMDCEKKKSLKDDPTSCWLEVLEQ